MKRKKTRKIRQKAKVAIWMPMPVALPEPGVVFQHFHEILLDAERKGLGRLLVNHRAGAMDYWRTRACLKAIEKGATHILMLDADHKHGPPDLVERLLKHNVPVVGSLNYARCNGKPCCVRKSSPVEAGTGLQKVDALGTGSLLIHLDSIKGLPQPWFFMAYGVHDDLGVDVWPGEDGGFSILCNMHGIPLHIDTDVTSPHANGTNWI